MPKLIRIQYPPTFDGELFIQVRKIDDNHFAYNFVHANKGGEWTTLVAAANAILAQDNRRKRILVEKGDLR